MTVTLDIACVILILLEEDADANGKKKWRKRDVTSDRFEMEKWKGERNDKFVGIRWILIDKIEKKCK